MYKYISAHKIVNSITNHEGLKTYYTLLLMAESEAEKDAVDKRFWQQFKELNFDEKTVIRKALQEAEKGLLHAAVDLHQEVQDFKAELRQAKKAA
jgi:isopenicillin N synthase-like dioxygenase